MSDPVARLNAALSGRYRVERQLGEGGMATVYLADDLRHGRKVALKVLKPELAAVVGAERFLAEIRTTANLQHPHILPLFDSGEAEGLLFYVMPAVEGESLRNRLDREHQLPVEEAVSIATAAAHALDYAHRHGVIHRDMKPANIMLHDGQPVIADFGIALAVSAAGGGRLTETGLSLGTPHYMSPEQATGDQSVGPTTDIWALGCVLYEMLAGEPPYTGSTPQAILGKIITEEPEPVTAERKATPPNVEATIARALEKLPADRFRSAEDFARALANIGFRHGSSADRPRSHSWRDALAGAAGGIVLTVILAGLLLTPSPQPVVLLGAVTKVTFDPGLELAPAISPNGQEVAFVSAPSAVGAGAETLSPGVMIRSIAGGSAFRVAGESYGVEEFPGWSPDGSSLSFHVEDRLYSVPARGGTPRAVAPAGALWGAWSPDNDRIAYVRFVDGVQSIFVRSLDGEEQKLTDTNGDAHLLRWSPDGRFIAFVEGNSLWVTLGRNFGNVAPSSIRIVSAEGGEPLSVTTSDYQNTSPAWLPDGRLLFVSSRGGVRDVYVLELARDGSPSEPVRVTAGLNPHTISISADGRRLAYSILSRTQNIHAMIIPADGPVSAYESSTVTVGQQVIEGIAVSADGDWLAFDSDRSGNQDGYRRRLDGGEPLRLAVSESDEFVHSWSPDGRWVAGHGFSRGNRDIYLVDPDGLEVVYPTPHPAEDRYPDVSPDGSRIAFASTRTATGVNAIFVIERDESGEWGDARQVSSAANRLSRWSPDGAQIVYTTADAVWVAPVSGAEPRLVMEDPDRERGVRIDAPEWYDEGRRVLFLRLFPDGTSGMWSIPAGGGPLEELIRFADRNRQPRPELAVHGDQIFFTIGDFESDIWVMDLEWP
jgi:serine/threonine-protein kinase